MKALICLWGLQRGDIKEVIDNYKNMFFGEVYFLISTWSDQD
jgi:hypothetical protein